jgi:hypothetical protein
MSNSNNNSLTRINQRGRLIKPSKRFTDNNTVTNPFSISITAKLAKKVTGTSPPTAPKPPVRRWRNPHAMRLPEYASHDDEEEEDEESREDPMEVVGKPVDMSENSSSSDETNDMFHPFVRLGDLARQKQQSTLADPVLKDRMAKQRSGTRYFTKDDQTMVMGNEALEEEDEEDDEPPPLMTLSELNRRRRWRKRHQEAQFNTKKAGWLTAAAYRADDGVIEVDMRDSPYLAEAEPNNHTSKGWLAPGVYRLPNGVLEVDLGDD